MVFAFVHGQLYGLHKTFRMQIENGPEAKCAKHPYGMEGPNPESCSARFHGNVK